MTTTRYPSATVTFDHLYEPGESFLDDEIGASWTLAHKPTACADPVTCHAYDDDDEHYYTLSVVLPTDDVEEEDALERLASILARHAGVTRLTFPDHPELDVS